MNPFKQTNCFKFGSEPETKCETKCVISVVNMWSDEKKSDDKVNLYIYDKEKYAAKIWRTNGTHTVADEVPIGCVNYCHVKASYITLGSHLFRIGGTCLSYTDRENLHKKIMEEYAENPTPNWGPHGHTGAHLDLIRRENSATDTVAIIDLNSNDDFMVAIEGPKMLFPRLRPHLLILQGNLYVAGGFQKYEDDVAFMEVLNRSAPAIKDWFWEDVPNPPPYSGSSSNTLQYRVITGAVESKGVIMVGFDTHSGYRFYTYQPTTKMWEIFANLRAPVPNLDCLTRSPAVVSDKFMLWVTQGRTGTLLYVMDLGNNAVVIIDLIDEKFLPKDESLNVPVLLKLKEGTFGVFWEEFALSATYLPKFNGRSGFTPKYSSGLDAYASLHASTFTLGVKKDGTLHVQWKKRFFSVIPINGLGLVDVCIVDVPDSERRNKQQQWTTFC